MSDTLFESYDDVQAYIAYRTGHWGAQTFTPSITHDITSIKVYAYHSGPADSLGPVIASIRAVDGEQKPTGPDLALKSLTKDYGGDAGVLHEWVFDTFAVGGKCTLDAGIQYAIVIRALEAPVSKYINVGRRFTSPAYPGGKLNDSVNGGVAWSILEQDWSFFEYGLAVGGAGRVGGIAGELVAAGQI